MTYVLGIEGSANKLGIGIINLKGDVIANVRKTYCAPIGTGFQPKEISVHHKKLILEVIFSTMKKHNVKFKDLLCIAYTKGPGMGACLIIGVIVARTLSQMFNVPIIGVNHCVGHIEMGRLVCKCDDPVVLYVSGGNTQVISYDKIRKRYLIYGEAIDIAVGNCLDKFARLVNISNDPNPGYNIERMAKKSNKDRYIEMPYSVKGMDVSFSGIVSWIERFALPKLKKKKFTVEDLCYSLQETIFAMLIEITERLLSYLKKSEVLIVGGVGCNKRLQEMMKIMLKERGGKVHAMDERYCIDNGCMIAFPGLLEFPHLLKQKEYKDLSKREVVLKLIKNSRVTQRFRTDQVLATWRDSK